MCTVWFIRYTHSTKKSRKSSSYHTCAHRSVSPLTDFTECVVLARLDMICGQDVTPPPPPPGYRRSVTWEQCSVLSRTRRQWPNSEGMQNSNNDEGYIAGCIRHRRLQSSRQLLHQNPIYYCTGWARVSPYNLGHLPCKGISHKTQVKYALLPPWLLFATIAEGIYRRTVSGNESAQYILQTLNTLLSTTYDTTAGCGSLPRRESRNASRCCRGPRPS